MLATELRERGNLIKGIEVFQHGRARTDRSRTAKRIAPTKEITGTSAPNLGAEAGAQPSESTGAQKESAGIDRLTRKPLIVCWSLSMSQEHYGELAAPSQHTKDTVLKEAILWAEREREADKWKWLEV